MNYTLVKPDGNIGATHNFDEAPPVLAPNKGKWLPDNPPAFNPATHARSRAAVQSVNAVEIAYTIQPRPAEELAAEAAQAEQVAYRQQVKADQFVNMTNADRNDYVDTACAGLPAPARNFLKKLAMLAQVVAKEQYK